MLVVECDGLGHDCFHNVLALVDNAMLGIQFLALGLALLPQRSGGSLGAVGDVVLLVQFAGAISNDQGDISQRPRGIAGGISLRSLGGGIIRAAAKD